MVTGRVKLLHQKNKYIDLANNNLIDGNNLLIKRVLFSSGASFLLQFINVIQPVLLVPLFLNNWGQDNYGRWIILTSLLTYFTLLDFGGQNYIGNLFSFALINGRQKKFIKRLSESISFFLFISLIALILLIFILILLNNINFSEKIIIFLVSSSFIISVPGGIYVTVYRASGLFARGAMIGSFFRTLQLIFSIIILYNHCSILQYSILLFIFSILLPIFIICDSRNKIIACKQIEINFKNAKNGIKFLKGSLRFWIISMSSLFNAQGILLIIGYFSSPALVVIYSTHKTIAGIINFIPMILQSSFWTDLNFLWSQKQFKKLKFIVLNSIFIVMIFSAIISTIIFLYSKIIFNLWISNKIIMNPSLLLIFLLQNFLFSGLVPQITAGAPSHFVVTFTLD